MINLCQTIQCPFAKGKRCEQYKSPNVCHLERYGGFEESRKWLFVPDNDGRIEVFQYYNNLWLNGELPLQQWYVQDDGFVSDYINRDTLEVETKNVFTNKVVDSKSFYNLVPYAIDMTDIILDFMDSDGVLVKKYQLGTIVVILSVFNTKIKMEFSEIKNLDSLKNTCLVAFDLLNISEYDAGPLLDGLNYVSFRLN